MVEGSRLDVLEGRVEEQSKNWTMLYGEIRRLDQKIELKIDRLRGDLLARIDAVDRRLDEKFDGKFNALNDKIDRHFIWLVGIQIAALVAIIGALLRR
jgi:hypothetical protein